MYASHSPTSGLALRAGGIKAAGQKNAQSERRQSFGPDSFFEQCAQLFCRILEIFRVAENPVWSGQPRKIPIGVSVGRRGGSAARNG